MRHDLKAILNESVHILNLSEETISVLEKFNIQTIAELLESDKALLKKDSRIGKKGIIEIYEALKSRGFEVR